ncbi:hypothetical protein J4434_02305 [Candidatus Woesearchaeota archaeon]|nr:hypothetical protein [Candidatus Woesearchaeota archaeon]
MKTNHSILSSPIDSVIDNVSILMDGAPITVQNSNSWPSKTFKRHTPILHLYAMLREKYPASIVTPVIDAKPLNFESMLPEIYKDFERFAGLIHTDLWLIDEAAIKQPRHDGRYNDSIREWVSFLNTLDLGLLRKIDEDKRFSVQDLIMVDGKVTDIREHGRLKCTIAELIVYYEKMKHITYATKEHLNNNRKVISNNSNVILLTGYDEGYLFLYGNGRHFKQIQSSLEVSLSQHYSKEVTIIDFMYGLNPDKNFNPIEYSKPFSQFSEEQQYAIRVANAAYCLATSFYLENITKTKLDEQDEQQLHKLRINAARPELTASLNRLIMDIDITNRDEIINKEKEIYNLLEA